MSMQDHLVKSLGLHGSGHEESSLRSAARVKRKTGGRVQRATGGAVSSESKMKRVGYQMPRKPKPGAENREPHFFGGLARGLKSVAKTGMKMAGAALKNPETRGKLVSGAKHLYNAAKTGGAKGVGNAIVGAAKNKAVRDDVINTGKSLYNEATAHKAGGSCKRARHAMGGVGKMRKDQYK